MHKQVLSQAGQSVRPAYVLKNSRMSGGSASRYSPMGPSLDPPFLTREAICKHRP